MHMSERLGSTNMSNKTKVLTRNTLILVVCSVKGRVVGPSAPIGVQGMGVTWSVAGQTDSLHHTEKR